MEDCSSALNMRPGYWKTLYKWEASLWDYEILQKEIPQDKEVNKSFVLARTKLNNNNDENKDNAS